MLRHKYFYNDVRTGESRRIDIGRLNVYIRLLGRAVPEEVVVGHKYTNSPTL